MRRGTSCLIIIAALVLGCSRRSDPASVDAAPPPPAPLPPRPPVVGALTGKEKFLGRLPTSTAPSTVVLAERVDAIAVSATTLYAFAPLPSPSEKHVLLARDLPGGARRVLAELSAESNDLTLIGTHLFWTERGTSGPAWLRRVMRANLDGTNIAEVLPEGTAGSHFYPAGNGEYVRLHEDKVYVFDGAETPRLLVTGGLLDAGSALANLHMAANLGADAERIYWSTVGDTTADAMLYSIARTGGSVRVDESKPVTLLGVTPAGIYIRSNGVATRRKDGARASLEGDAQGRLDGARLAGSDAYVHLMRLIGQGDVQRIVVKLGHDAKKVEPVVDAWSFDVNGDKLYFATDKDVRVMAR